MEVNKWFKNKNQKIKEALKILWSDKEVQD